MLFDMKIIILRQSQESLSKFKKEDICVKDMLLLQEWN